MNVNERHHSLAFIETGRNAAHHMMIELYSFDDVGQGYDLAQAETAVSRSRSAAIGDYITSFYSWNPSGFMTEYGWARNRSIRQLQPFERKFGASLWAMTAPGDARQADRGARIAKAGAEAAAPARPGDRGQLHPDARPVPVARRAEERAEDRLNAPAEARSSNIPCVP